MTRTLASMAATSPGLIERESGPCELIVSRSRRPSRGRRREGSRRWACFAQLTNPRRETGPNSAAGINTASDFVQFEYLQTCPS